MIESSIAWLFDLLALPEVGLTSVFFISLISATLLPVGSEPAVFAVVKANANLFWAAILVATAGNTVGGIIDYWLGFGAKTAFAKERGTHWFGWLERFGPRALILAWLPLVGDPLCVLAGWLKLPFWPSVAWMALGKFLRYLCITGLLLMVPDGFWRDVMQMLG